MRGETRRVRNDRMILGKGLKNTGDIHAQLKYNLRARYMVYIIDIYASGPSRKHLANHRQIQTYKKDTHSKEKEKMIGNEPHSSVIVRGQPAAGFLVTPDFGVGRQRCNEFTARSGNWIRSIRHFGVEAAAIARLVLGTCMPWHSQRLNVSRVGTSPREEQ
jgi:hypothetical protein